MPPDRENHVWLRAKRFTCQLHRLSLGGISLHDQVASLNIPEPTKFVEKHSIEWKTAGFGDLCYWDSNRNKGNTIDIRGLLGPCLSQAGCDQQTGYELPPLHSITSSARASSVGEKQLHRFDHFVGADTQRWRDGDAERSCRVEVYHKFKFRRLLDWLVRRLCTL